MEIKKYFYVYQYISKNFILKMLLRIYLGVAVVTLDI